MVTIYEPHTPIGTAWGGIGCSIAVYSDPISVVWIVGTWSFVMMPQYRNSTVDSSAACGNMSHFVEDISVRRPPRQVVREYDERKIKASMLQTMYYSGLASWMESD